MKTIQDSSQYIGEPSTEMQKENNVTISVVVFGNEDEHVAVRRQPSIIVSPTATENFTSADGVRVTGKLHR